MALFYTKFASFLGALGVFAHSIQNAQAEIYERQFSFYSSYKESNNFKQTAIATSSLIYDSSNSQIFHNSVSILIVQTMEHIFACIGKVQAEKNSKRCFFKFYKFSLPSENYPSNYSCLDDLTCDSTYYSETPKFTTADAATNLSIDFPYSVDSKKIVDYSIEPKKENECTQNAFRIDINKEKHGIRSIQPNLAESIKTENNQKPENEGIANGCLAPRNERCSFEDKTVSESPQSIMIFQPKDIELIPSEAEKSYEENEPCQEPISATLIHDDDTEYVLEDKLVKEINDNEAKITEARVMAARKILSIALRKLEEQINNNSMRH